MRALCGAIITAGALIGLGFTAIGIGTRYQSFADRESVGGEWKRIMVHQIDNPLILILTLLTLTLVIGLAISFLGLALHHERRHRERLRDLGRHPREDVSA